MNKRKPLTEEHTKEVLEAMKSYFYSTMREYISQLIQPFVTENKHRLELMYLPPYSPNLNLIQGLCFL